MAATCELMMGDCLELMPTIAAGSVDMVLCDLPYGTTACKWDSVIPFEPLWAEYRRVCKPNAAIVLTASQPFTTALIASNFGMFKYVWVWDKKIPSGMSYARFQPMRQHEDVLVFCCGKTTYNPQMVKRDKPIKGGGMSKGETTSNHKLTALKKTYDYKNPTTIIQFDKIRRGSHHPTQKTRRLDGIPNPHIYQRGRNRSGQYDGIRHDRRGLPQHGPQLHRH